MAYTTYGFSDQHGNIISYVPFSDDEAAELYALELLDRGYMSIEWWADERDENGELPESKVVSR